VDRAYFLKTPGLVTNPTSVFFFCSPKKCKFWLKVKATAEKKNIRKGETIYETSDVNTARTTEENVTPCSPVGVYRRFGGT
jgi:hypothetical protein